MQKSRALFRMGVIGILVLSIFLCSFMNGMVQQSSIPGRQIPTVPPIVATIPTAIGAQTPVATPIPTLGPGQYFEEGQEPEIITMHGDDKFGWGELARNENLLLIWVTDEYGTHYLVIEKDNEKFMGNDIRKDGFVHYVGNDDGGRVSLVEKLNKSRNRGKASSGAIIACGFLLIFGPAGWASSITIAAIAGLGEAAGESFYQDQLEESIATLEANLLARFSQMQYSYPHSWR